jgi:hypothetical protein
MSGEDVFDEINASTGLLGAAETAIVMRRRRGEDTATLHITGKDVDEQELAMQFVADTGSWVILGDAADCAETQEQQEVLDALEALGGEATPKAIQEELGPGRSHSAVKQLMWRMAQKGLLVAVEGKYRRNEVTPGATAHSAQSGVTGVTAVTPVTAVTDETEAQPEQEGNPEPERNPAPEGNTVTRVTPVTGVTRVTRLATENAPGQAAAGLIDAEELRAAILVKAEMRHWRGIMAAGALRGGSSFTWQKFVELADVALLKAALHGLNTGLGGA